MQKSVAAVLAELAGAGIAERIEQGNAHLYRLRRPERLADLVGSDSLVVVDWVAAARLVDTYLWLFRLHRLPPLVRRVEAAKLRAPLAAAASLLKMPTPPAVRGVAAGWELLVAWASDAIRELDPAEGIRTA